MVAEDEVEAEIFEIEEYCCPRDEDIMVALELNVRPQQVVAAPAPLIGVFDPNEEFDTDESDVTSEF